VKSEFLLAFNQVCSNRGLSRAVVLEALEAALESAYRRNTGNETSQNVAAKIDLETGEAQVFIEKQVVEEVSDPDVEISLADAGALDPDAELGAGVMIEDTPEDFGRIAAQNAKQIILQRIREAERDARYAQYVQQEGEIVHGTVQSVKSQVVTLHLEGTEAILPRSQQVRGERYSLHQRLRAYVLEVRKTNRGPQIVVSRSHKNMLRRLLELEVPEIFNGAVEIKSISREAGSRSKVAVAARQAGVDPVGACVGMRGVRIQSIVNELGGEKIDVIEWNPDPSIFIAKSLSPAKVLCVQLEEDPVAGRTASVIVPDDQLSLAIGRAGQNARLAAKLTGWRIDIQGVTEAATWALKQVNEDSEVLLALGPVAELLPNVASILRQHEQEDLPYNSGELLTMRRVIEGVGDYYASIRDAERARRMEEEAARRAAIEAAEAERREAIEAARARISPRAYGIPLAEMGLSARVFGHLERTEMETAGDVMEHLAEGDEGLLKFNGIGPKSLAEIKECIEALDLRETGEEAPAEEEVVAEPELEAEAAPPAEEEVVAELEPEPEAVAAPLAEEEAVAELEPEPEAVAAPPAEPAPEEAVVAAEPEPAVEAAEPEPVEEEPSELEAEEEEAEPPEPDLEEMELDADEEMELDAEEEERRERARRRRLVYDEELDEVVALHRHKRDDEESWKRHLR